VVAVVIGTIAVAIPAHPARMRPSGPGGMSLLDRAVASAGRQTRCYDQLVVAVDRQGAGSWQARNAALAMVTADWVAWLDSDDMFKRRHLEVLEQAATMAGADYVFSWFDDRYCSDVLGNFGKPFDPAWPHATTSTILVRAELAKKVGYSPPEQGDANGGEDWRFTLDCVAAGARIFHVAERTWYWVWHADPRDPDGRVEAPNGHALANTSGRPDCGDARSDADIAAARRPVGATDQAEEDSHG
jgi:hypothetical protein